MRKAFPKAITEWNLKRIGAATIALILAVVGCSLALSSNIFASTYSVKADFSNAVGLNSGDEVLLAGVNIGKVSSVSVQGNHVVTVLAINDGVKLPSDSSAAISVETLLGVIGVNIAAGGNWATLLHNGSTISDTSVPFEFFEIQNSAGQLLSASDAKALGSVVSGLASATSGDKAQIQELIDGLAKFTTTVGNHQLQAGQLIDAAEVLSSTLASKDKQLATVVDDLDSLVSGLASRSQQLGQLIDATEAAASQTASLVSRNQPQLQQLLTSLHSALSVVGSHQLDLARAVSYAAAAIKGFSSIGQSGPSSTPWANIYTDLVGASVGDEVLGSCGVLDHVLDLALGPDPRPCDERNGPVPTETTGAGSAPVSSLYAPLTGRSS